MGWIGTAFGVVALLRLWGTGHPVPTALAVLASLGAFLSWGVMHNFATEAAKLRQGYKGGFYDITPEEALSVPDWISTVHMVFTLMGLALLITSFIV